MAKRPPTSPEPQRAILDPARIPWAIEKIERRVKDLRGINAKDVNDFWGTAASLANKTNDTLAEVFGLNTIEFDRAHLSSASFTYNVMPYDGEQHSRHFDEEAMREGIQSAVRLLETELELLREKMADGHVTPYASGAQHGPKTNDRDVFVVHGRDDGAKAQVARFISKIGLNPVILHEQVDAGRTVMEKFEAHSDVGFAVVIATPDDVGALEIDFKKDANSLKSRARQNVLLELGFFVGKLSRKRVCALAKGSIEVPSDYAGVLFTQMSDDEAWHLKLARELKAAGMAVDVSKII